MHFTSIFLVKDRIGEEFFADLDHHPYIQGNLANVSVTFCKGTYPITSFSHFAEWIHKAKDFLWRWLPTN